MQTSILCNHHRRRRHYHGAKPTAAAAAAANDAQAFMVEPVKTWTWGQALLFPWLFVIPAEILALISSSLIYVLGE